MNGSIGVVERAKATVDHCPSARWEHSATTVYEIDPLSDSRWEAFLHVHPQATVFHSTNWLKALQTCYGYDPVVFTKCPPSTPLTNGLVSCRVKSWLTGWRLVSLPFSDYCDPLVHDPQELDDLLLHMKRSVDAGKWKYIEIRPTSHKPAAHTQFHQSITYRIHHLDLGKSKQELFNSFHKSCIQRKIRRAKRERLHCEYGTSQVLINKFYNLLVATRRRQRLPPQPMSWFRTLIDTFGDGVKIRVASKDHLPIAAILTISHNKSMFYKYGCSDARFHKFGGMALLFWNAIQEAQENGMEEFNLGRSDHDNLGLIAFKEHWGAVGRPLIHWTYPQRPATPLNVWEKAVLSKFVPVAPDFALRTVGRLLYRHIG